MRSIAFVSVALAAASQVLAVSEWGQCGGNGWTGSTTCDAGLTCIHVNDWYYQCQKGGSSGTTTTRVPTTTSVSATRPTTTHTSPPATGTELPYGTLVTGCTVPNTIAITFDDGPYQYTSGLIDSLNAAGVKATFFMCGLVYGCIYDYADVVKKAYHSGHQIAAHTWDHPHLPTLNASDITMEMTKLETAFKKILGIRPKWVRPPYGEYNDAVLGTLKDLGYKAVTWNLDTQDWAGTPVNTSEAQFTALGADPRIIPLEHDPIQTTSEQLGPWIAQWAKGRGLKAVTLSECLGEPVPAGQYVFTGGAGTKDSTWVC